MRALLKIFSAFAFFLLLNGCASIIGQTSQQIRIETFNQQGEPITGANCNLGNDFGQNSGAVPGQITVHRSSKDLRVECSKPGYADAYAQAVSRANIGMYGNILFGGIIGVVVDHSRGAGYTYPQWMNLVMGNTLDFDRSRDKDGQASVGTTRNGAPVTIAVQAANTAVPAEGTGVSVALVSNDPVAATLRPAAPTAQLKPMQDGGEATIQTVEFNVGSSSVTVEKMARAAGCQGGKGAGLLTAQGPVEVYRMRCDSGKTFMAKCELHQCSAMH